MVAKKKTEGKTVGLIPRYPYIIAYRERSDTVEILLVVHTSRRWPKHLPPSPLL